MSVLPELLRRMALAARDRDKRMLGRVLNELGRHGGRSKAIVEFIDRMPARDARFISSFQNAQANRGTPSPAADYGIVGNRADGISQVDKFPRTPADLTTALGFGTWTTGALWTGDTPSGALNRVYGTPDFTASGSPLYSQAGPQGWDRSVGFGSTTTTWAAGNNFNVATASDLFVVMVLKRIGSTSGQPAVLLKYSATAYWGITYSATNIGLVCTGGGATLAQDLPLNAYGVLGGVIDRGTAKSRIAWRATDGSSSATGAETAAPVADFTNVNNLQLGRNSDSTDIAHVNLLVSHIYLVTGSGVASGASASLATALANFTNYLAR